ncbi:BTB/POZ domain-containing protein 1 [Cyphellophora attinorum]|uniref:BTB/POZ domain-containing protein 1 n=1 Tax=Cyphellophora attinorum TaxID=1664694 RepID=A0A0N1H820_9EURO|nr:BTB/POZ domain-containing protein 1 [Phialophora attinorum]KPI39366.1 BTB/POZ domain-containing protein 1 [Phialophora attinorum]
MSHRLWEALLQDDAERFRLYLAEATYNANARQSSAPSLKIGSPGSLGTSPHSALKSRKSSGNVQNTPRTNKNGGAALTRLDVNSRDSFGRTLLHHAATQAGETASEFIAALLDIPFIDLYAQDLESGWTPLHRALYFGNVGTAQALMRRDLQDATDYTTTAAHAQAGGLVKIKDNEGNSPFEVFQLTIAPRILQSSSHTIGDGDSDGSNSVDLNEDNNSTQIMRQVEKHSIHLDGHEIFAFGSNKNLNLGVGDEDDRHFPERISLRRPDQLLFRLFQDHSAECATKAFPDETARSLPIPSSVEEIPCIVANKPISIRNVVMSKLHTAILTDDPISNLHVCGFGPGGRLGTGDERTSFGFRCIQGGGLAKKRIANVALGQDHTIAICSQGEVFTWGSNKYGQLGYALPEVSGNDVPMQLLPRQLYGFVKKELVIGATASAIHSAIYTAGALYTFGKNEGQLGLMDADARSLEMVTTPRRVAPSVLTTPIASVSAIDRATAVLLANHEVIVFTHFGYTRIAFRLEGYMRSLSPDFPGFQQNHIMRLNAGANTIAALSAFGEVFTVEVPKVPETVSASVSTTNPSKARNALPPSVRVWSLRKEHMSATDVAVGQDGSVILCTRSGSVWRKEKRAKIKSVNHEGAARSKTKDYKFVRVPNLTRAIAVRSNAFGAYTAIRKDSDVTHTQIAVESPTLWSSMFPLLAFHQYGEVKDDDETIDNPPLRFWVPMGRGPNTAQLKVAVITRPDAESEIKHICQMQATPGSSLCDLWIGSTVTDVRIPVHSFVLQGRSSVMRTALTQFRQSYYYAIADVLSLEYGRDGQAQLIFNGADFLTLVNLVLYLYTDDIVDVWHHTSKALHLAPRYRAVRVELMKIASNLELRQLERAARLMIDPIRSLAHDMEHAVVDHDFFLDADVMIDLADGAEIPAHSVLLTARCPFFEGLFQGRTGGMWMAARRDEAQDKAELMRVDLKHLNSNVFKLVLRHLYADTGLELFDDLVTSDFDAFADILLQVLSAADELMIDRLAQICQSILGRYVNIRNVCYLLNTVAECQVTEFKNAALEYICLNLEAMLEQRLLEDLDPDLLAELDEVVQQNQLAYLPFARSSRTYDELVDRYPELAEQMDLGKRRRIDSMRLRTRLADAQVKEDASHKFRVGSVDKYGSSPSLVRRSSGPGSAETTPESSPAIAAQEGGEDFPFEMDEGEALGSPSLPANEPRSRRPMDAHQDLIVPQPLSSPSLDSAHHRDRAMNRAGTSAADNTAPEPERGFGTTKAPWQTPSPTSHRVDLRDIMSQASASKVSNLSQSLAKADSQAKARQKMSQKDRKKQSQQAKHEQIEVPKPLPPAEMSAGKPQSVWQTVRKPSGSVAVVQSSQARATTPHRPTMTMRQTVAGSPAPASPPLQSPVPSSPAAVSASKPAQPVIQSIRHTPSRASTLSALDARASMADILSQQQGEKIAVKEAVAKRSLQDIQQEQEFQAWWDSESRRIQEEESAASRNAGRSKGSRGRGQAGRRGGGNRGARRGSQGPNEGLTQADTQDATVPAQRVAHSQVQPSARGDARPYAHARRGRVSSPGHG